MPVLDIKVNVPLTTEVKDKFIAEAASTITNLTGKADQWVMIVIQDNATISFASKQTPALWSTITNIGEFDTRTINQVVRDLSALIHKSFGVDPSRIYLGFNFPQPNHFAWNGTTF